MYTHTYACTYTQTHVQIHTRIHTHTNTHTHTPLKKVAVFRYIHSQSQVLHSRGRQRAQHTPSFALTLLNY
ncbi:unnamed protein product [Staurois parvus]|uniref:C2H2-type domain-containing protein n=1 Tax=Staurois parvus TaxID=386267 RepID=A0ABN9HV62_9NEOB|nr:unnamed protein product [Staurois parvus]